MKKAGAGGDMRIEYLALAVLVKWPKNPKDHDLDALGASFRRFGYVDPIIIDERSGKMVAGHGRLDRLEESKAGGEKSPERIKVRADGEWLVPVLRGVSFKSTKEAAAYLIANNQQAMLCGFDQDLLAEFVKENHVDIEAEGIGFTDRDLRALEALGAGGSSGGADPDDVPELAKDPVTRPGDLWVMGKHRLVCGDTTDPATVARAMGELGAAALAHADPPYGMGKEKDGVANDNLYDEKLDAFQMAWWRTWLPHFRKNASAYIWGNAPDLWRLWYSGGLSADKELMVRNELVWDKGSGFGMATEAAHSYPPATERCLFLMRGPQFLGNQNKDDFWEGYEPLRSWLEAERNKAGWTNGDVNKLTKTSMAGHWFTRSQFMAISAENYDTLRKAAGGKAFVETYGDLFDRLFPSVRSGGNEHRRELSARLRDYRSTFDNTHDVMTDVWQFPRVVGEERFGHATPKPVAMVSRALRSSSEDGDVVVVPFGGTGPEWIAGEQLGRVIVGAELEPAYCDVIVRRWEAFTGKKAKLIRGRAGPPGKAAKGMRRSK